MPSESLQEVTVEQIISAINSVLSERRREVQPITADTQLDDLRLNSLDVAEVFVQLEEIVGYELDPESAPEARVVRDLTAVHPL